MSDFAIAHPGLYITEGHLAGFDDELVDSKSTLFEKVNE